MQVKDIINKSGYYRVKVNPSQHSIKFSGMMADGTIKISLTATPERGKANRQLLDFLIEELNGKFQNIKIVSGLTSRIKVIAIEM